MARGKHASSAAARHAREEAISTAARLSKENERLTAELAAAQDAIAALRVQVADGVSADLTRARTQLATAEEERRRLKVIVDAARAANAKTYEATVKQIAKMGLTLDQASDIADSCTQFMVGDEFLGSRDVEVDWYEGKVKRFRRKMGTGVARKAAHRAAELSNAAMARQSQGIQ